jgi:hypothetical protein
MKTELRQRILKLIDCRGGYVIINVHYGGDTTVYHLSKKHGLYYLVMNNGQFIKMGPVYELHHWFDKMENCVSQKNIVNVFK